MAISLQPYEDLSPYVADLSTLPTLSQEEEAALLQRMRPGSAGGASCQ